MTTPSGKDPARLLEEALRARAGSGRSFDAAAPPKAGRPASGPPLTLLQLVLASLIVGLVVGILLAVLTLI